MASTISDTLKVNGLQVGNIAAPPDLSAGTGAMVTTNRVNGALHMRTDADNRIECIHNGAVRKLGLADDAIECRLGTIAANSANTYTTYARKNGIITAVKRRYATAPGSAAGTVVVGITIGGNAILASASENEEGLTNDTLTLHALTGTTANLKFSAGDKIVITVTSNNGDMTGGTDCQYFLMYDHN